MRTQPNSVHARGAWLAVVLAVACCVFLFPVVATSVQEPDGDQTRASAQSYPSSSLEQTERRVNGFPPTYPTSTTKDSLSEGETGPTWQRWIALPAPRTLAMSVVWRHYLLVVGGSKESVSAVVRARQNDSGASALQRNTTGSFKDDSDSPFALWIDMTYLYSFSALSLKPSEQIRKPKAMLNKDVVGDGLASLNSYRMPPVRGRAAALATVNGFVVSYAADMIAESSEFVEVHVSEDESSGKGKASAAAAGSQPNLRMTGSLSGTVYPLRSSVLTRRRAALGSMRSFEVGKKSVLEVEPDQASPGSFFSSCGGETVQPKEKYHMFLFGGERTSQENPGSAVRRGVKYVEAYDWDNDFWEVIPEHMPVIPLPGTLPLSNTTATFCDCAVVQRPGISGSPVEVSDDIDGGTDVLYIHSCVDCNSSQIIPYVLEFNTTVRRFLPVQLQPLDNTNPSYFPGAGGIEEGSANSGRHSVVGAGTSYITTLTYNDQGLRDNGKENIASQDSINVSARTTKTMKLSMYDIQLQQASTMPAETHHDRVGCALHSVQGQVYCLGGNKMDSDAITIESAHTLGRGASERASLNDARSTRLRGAPVPASESASIIPTPTTTLNHADGMYTVRNPDDASSSAPRGSDGYAEQLQNLSWYNTNDRSSNCSEEERDSEGCDADNPDVEVYTGASCSASGNAGDGSSYQPWLRLATDLSCEEPIAGVTDIPCTPHARFPTYDFIRLNSGSQLDAFVCITYGSCAFSADEEKSLCTVATPVSSAGDGTVNADDSSNAGPKSSNITDMYTCLSQPCCWDATLQQCYRYKEATRDTRVTDTVRIKQAVWAAASLQTVRFVSESRTADPSGGGTTPSGYRLWGGVVQKVLLYITCFGGAIAFSLIFIYCFLRKTPLDVEQATQRLDFQQQALFHPLILNTAGLNEGEGTPKRASPADKKGRAIAINVSPGNGAKQGDSLPSSTDTEKRWIAQWLTQIPSDLQHVMPWRDGRAGEGYHAADDGINSHAVEHVNADVEVVINVIPPEPRERTELVRSQSSVKSAQAFADNTNIRMVSVLGKTYQLLQQIDGFADEGTDLVTLWTSGRCQVFLAERLITGESVFDSRDPTDVFSSDQNVKSSVDVPGAKTAPIHPLLVVKVVTCNTKTEREEALEVYDLMQGLHHPHLAPLHDIIVEWNTPAPIDATMQASEPLAPVERPVRVCLMMDYYPLRDLSTFIKSELEKQRKRYAELGKCRGLSCTLGTCDQRDSQSNEQPQCHPVFYLDEMLLWEWTTQLADVLSYLHSQSEPVIHGDVKPENVFLAKPKRIVLADFCCLRRMGKNRGRVASKTVEGTLMYAAPELVSPDIRRLESEEAIASAYTTGGTGGAATPKKPQQQASSWNERHDARRGHAQHPSSSPATDMWSLGCLLFALSTLRLSAHDTVAMFAQVSKPDFATFLSTSLQYTGSHPEPPPQEGGGAAPSVNANVVAPSYSNAWVDLIKKLLQEDPAERLTACEVLHLSKNRISYLREQRRTKRTAEEHERAKQRSAARNSRSQRDANENGNAE